MRVRTQVSTVEKGAGEALCRRYGRTTKQAHQAVLGAELIFCFSGTLSIEGMATPGMTGWFEVEVNGNLLHSKKNGDGYVDTPAKMDKIVAGIKNALGA